MISKENIERLIDMARETDFRRCPDLTECECMPNQMTQKEQEEACEKCWRRVLENGDN